MKQLFETKGLNGRRATKEGKLISCFLATLLLFPIFVSSCSCDDPLTVKRPPIIEDTTFNVITNPFWSHDGKKIIFLGRIFGIYGDGFYDVDTMGGKARLLYRDSLTKGSAILSPDGSKIAYLAEDQVRYFCCAHVWVINVDGTNARDLTPLAGGGFDDELRWSPDSRYIILHGRVQDSIGIHNQIIRIDSETGAAKLLTSGISDNMEPSYTYDGLKIVFYSFRFRTDGGGKVFVMNADGTNQIPIDTTRRASRVPQPSPINNNLIFGWALNESQQGIYTVNLDSITLPANPNTYRLITQTHGAEQWSPDGKSLLYFRESGNIRDLYSIKFDGGAIKRITTNFWVYIFSYPWSPDSRRLIFAASDDGSQTYRVFRYDFDSTKLTKLTITP